MLIYSLYHIQHVTQNLNFFQKINGAFFERLRHNILHLSCPIGFNGFYSDWIFASFYGWCLSGWLYSLYVSSVDCWGCLIIFLPIILLLHIVLNYKLKKRIQKMENQQSSAINHSLYRAWWGKNDFFYNIIGWSCYFRTHHPGYFKQYDDCWNLLLLYQTCEIILSYE